MTLKEVVEQFIAQLRSTGTVLISAPFVADQVCLGFPHWAVMVEAEQQAAYKGTAQEAREALRRHGEREYDQAVLAQTEMVFEADVLNDGYSVQRGTGGGRDRDYVYVPRLIMTYEDVCYVDRRLRKVAEHLIRHADALLADWHRRNPAAAE